MSNACIKLYTLGSSDKFYELKHTDDGVVVIRYGRRLAAGATSEKKFSSNDEVTVTYWLLRGEY